MIELYNGYVIQVEDNGYSLGRRSIVKKGKSKGDERIRPFAYYSSVEKCLERFSEELQHDALSDASSQLQPALATMYESRIQFADFLRESLPKYKVVKAE